MVKLDGLSAVAMVALAALSLAGCQTTSASDSDAATASTPTEAAPTAQFKEGFSYSWPTAEVAAERGLAANLEAKRVAAKAAFDKNVADYNKAAGGPPANALTSGHQWRVDGKTAGLMVLLADGYSYEGGAHGMNWTSALIWDRKAGKEVRAADLFTDAGQANIAIRPAFCAAVDAERFNRRKEATPKTELFGDCVNPFESMVYPTGVKAGKFTRIGFSLAPYVAGPYVEGQYNLSIPMTAPLRALIKPEYQALFAT